MEPGTTLSLADDTFLQPLPDSARPQPDEHVVLLVEGYVAFLDGEIARMGPNGGEDELELFEGLVGVPEEAILARPEERAARTRWALNLYRDFISPQVAAMRSPVRIRPAAGEGWPPLERSAPACR